MALEKPRKLWKVFLLLFWPPWLCFLVTNCHHFDCVVTERVDCHARCEEMVAKCQVVMLSFTHFNTTQLLFTSQNKFYNRRLHGL